MTCYSPLHAYEGKLKENGKIDIAWKLSDSCEGIKLDLPCGKCVGCRLERSRQWALRCVHEASLHERNCFVTLTYKDEHIPDGGNLVLADYQNFMKRLRKDASILRGKGSAGIRFFHAGEYGTEKGRPHYHALLFNCDFEDKKKLMERDGNIFYRSKYLESLWDKGFSSIGEVNFATAAYVARYVMKKVGDSYDYFKDSSTGFRMQVSKASGEVKVAEYTTMSRRDGIGKEWFDRFHGEVYPLDNVVVNGRETRPPRYYDNLLDKVNPEMLESLKLKRRLEMPNWRFENGQYINENGDERLRVKEYVKSEQIKSLKRGLEV